jgi:hypothetical protein
MKVQVFAYKGYLVVAPNEPEQGINDNWWPTGGKDGDRLGCVLGDSEKNLGVSPEAIELMKTIEVGRDAIGDLDWWWCTDETYAFSWWGPIFRIIEPKTCVTARGFRPRPDKCSTIDNELPSELRTKVDAWIEKQDEDLVAWDEPFAIEYEDKEDEE